MDPGLYYVVLLSLLFMGWFGIGYWRNLRLKSRILSEIMKILGEEARENLRYTSLGSTGFMLSARLGEVLVSATLLLGKREFPVMWAVDYFRGRRDRLELYVEMPRSDECVGVSCFNTATYWGRLMWRKIAVRGKRRDGWVCKGRNERFEEALKGLAYAFILRAKKDRCYLRVMCNPEYAREVLRFVLGEATRS